MISFDDRISSFIIVIIARQEREERARIKYIMIFYRKHDSTNKHLWNLSLARNKLFCGKGKNERQRK